jgi:hypothetical protein
LTGGIRIGRSILTAACSNAHPIVFLPKSPIAPYFLGPLPMAKSQRYRFCFGPWNISEGTDPYGPPTRPPQSFDWKLAQLKKLGFDAMMFHDDDAVPDIDEKATPNSARNPAS